LALEAAMKEHIVESGFVRKGKKGEPKRRWMRSWPYVEEFAIFLVLFAVLIIVTMLF
jgi:hypothetical protein